MKFLGTKGKWELKSEIKKNEYDVEYFSIDHIEVNAQECINVYFDCRLDYKESFNEAKANALLISRSPILIEEHIKEIDFLKRIKKQLDDLGGSMEFEVEERILEIEQLIKEATEL